jgi:hypothetical protein
MTTVRVNDMTTVRVNRHDDVPDGPQVSAER